MYIILCYICIKFYLLFIIKFSRISFLHLNINLRYLNIFEMASKTELKVIGAGFGRTGTTSLKKALEILGVGPCFHLNEIINGPDKQVKVCLG